MSGLREQMEAMVARVDDIHEKMSVNPEAPILLQV